VHILPNIRVGTAIMRIAKNIHKRHTSMNEALFIRHQLTCNCQLLYFPFSFSRWDPAFRDFKEVTHERLLKSFGDMLNRVQEKDVRKLFSEPYVSHETVQNTPMYSAPCSDQVLPRHTFLQDVLRAVQRMSSVTSGSRLANQQEIVDGVKDEGIQVWGGIVHRS
jgi:hypothetical protein